MHLPVPVVSIVPDFTKKPTKGARVPNSRITHLPVLPGILDPDFTKKSKKGPGTAREANTLPGSSGAPRSRLYIKINKGGNQ